jgi:hypothetical protein
MSEVFPDGTPAVESDSHDNPNRYSEHVKQEFCFWTVFEREAAYPWHHGPPRFSFLYLCTEGVASFMGLYIRRGISPSAVAIIQSGYGFGHNWTCFEDPTRALAKAVLSNPAGTPEYLLYGGIGPEYYCNYYDVPCWSIYSNLIRFRPKQFGGKIGLWARPNAWKTYPLRRSWPRG